MYELARDVARAGNEPPVGVVAYAALNADGGAFDVVCGAAGRDERELLAELAEGGCTGGGEERDTAAVEDSAGEAGELTAGGGEAGVEPESETGALSIG